jgi:3-deoxy-manno-octulosonate cytidylyltransferase (CMP-KDO synthetase)
LPDATIIIPARMGSTRFPGKVLASATGKPLIQHVWEAAKQAASARHVVIATDDAQVQAAVTAFGGQSVMTSPDHPNGTSRLAEAARKLGLAPDAVVVNVQGDEPELEPALIDNAVAALERTGAPVATIAQPFDGAEDPANPNLVKVVLRKDGTALYFSRALIPFPRDGAPASAQASESHEAPLKHVGLYVYRRAFLDKYVKLEPTALERTEHLEQLRILYHGFAIAVAVAPSRSYGGIDTPEQYEAFVKRWRERTRG